VAVRGTFERIVRAPIAMRWLAAACVLVTALSHPAPGAVPEYELKAAIIYKIGKFVRWPDPPDQGHGTLKVCVVGRDEFGGSIDDLAGQRIHDQVIEVQRFAAYAPDTLQCQIAFISRSEEANASALVAYIGRAPVLTISDIDGFAALGGIVGFVTHDSKVTFQINPVAGRRAGLEISAQLLQLATLVTDAQTRIVQ
jgi:hypothetical protein